MASTLIILIFILEYFHHETTQNEQPQKQKAIHSDCLQDSQIEFPGYPDEGWYTLIKCPATIREKLGDHQKPMLPGNGHWYLTIPRDSQPIPLSSPAGGVSDADSKGPEPGP